MAVTVDVLNAAQQLSLPELEGALAEADLLRLSRKAIPPAVQHRYD